jgi:hypothetical protein
VAEFAPGSQSPWSQPSRSRGMADPALPVAEQPPRREPMGRDGSRKPGFPTRLRGCGIAGGVARLARGGFGNPPRALAMGDVAQSGDRPQRRASGRAESTGLRLSGSLDEAVDVWYRPGVRGRCRDVLPAPQPANHFTGGIAMSKRAVRWGLPPSRGRTFFPGALHAPPRLCADGDPGLSVGRAVR